MIHRVVALTSLSYAAGFVFQASKPRFERTSLFDGQSSGVQLVSLEGLGDDHESVGESMANSLASWVRRSKSETTLHMLSTPTGRLLLSLLLVSVSSLTMNGSLRRCT